MYSVNVFSVSSKYSTFFSLSTMYSIFPYQACTLCMFFRYQACTLFFRIKHVLCVCFSRIKHILYFSVPSTYSVCGFFFSYQACTLCRVFCIKHVLYVALSSYQTCPLYRFLLFSFSLSSMYSV